MRGLFRLTTIGAVLAVTARARAQDTSLTWDAPAGCPTADEVRRDVARLVGHDLEGSGVRANGRVTQDGARWHVELDLLLPDGSRRRDLDGDSCAEVSVAAATVIALAVDPSAGASKPAPPQSGEHAPSNPQKPRETARQPEPVARRTPAPPPRPPAQRRLGFALEAFGAVDARSLPDPSPGLGAGGAVIVAPLRVDLTIASFLARRTTLDTASADVSLTAVALRGAWEFPISRFSVRPGLVGEGGWASARSEGVSAPGDGTARWWALGVGCTLGVAFGRHFAVDGGIDALGVLARDEFVIVGRGPVFRPPPWTLRAALGVEWRLP